VSTPSFALCADDDYFDITFLQTAAEYLAVNPGAARVYGITVGFQRLEPRNLDIDLACMPVPGKSSEHGENQFLDYFATFRPQTFYGVNHTATGKAILDVLASTPDSCFQFAETMWYASPYLFGSVDYLSQLMNVRSIEPRVPNYRWTYAGFAATGPCDMTWMADFEGQVDFLAAKGLLSDAHARILRAGALSTLLRLHQTATVTGAVETLRGNVWSRLARVLGRQRERRTVMEPALRDASMAVLNQAGWNTE
jgi:hypothetical protein